MYRKEEIVTHFTKPDGKLCIVIATIAFDMGLDCPNVRQLFHWGASHDIESYIRETGRCGRDDFTAKAIPFHSSAEHRITSPAMQPYRQNNVTCRRDILFHDLMTQSLVPHAYVVMCVHKFVSVKAVACHHMHLFFIYRELKINFVCSVLVLYFFNVSL